MQGWLAAGVSLGIATSAAAQTEPAGAGAAAPVPAQAQSQSDTGDGALSDIIVTAQRRSERLQDVPIAVTAADADALATARVDNISNITAISPSIQFRASNISSSTANVIIRGLGTTGNSRSFEGAVGIFIDGVYRTRAASALENFLDVGSVQVLRGPQGTLFGKNTSGGAVLIDSTRPNVNRVEGRYEASYGNEDIYSGKAAINVPLVDGVAALRVSALYGKSAGFLTDVNTGEDVNGKTSRAFKAQLLIDPSDSYALQLIGDYSKSTGNCCYGSVDYINGPTQPLIDGLTRAGGLAVPQGYPARQTALTQPTRQTVTDYGFTGIFTAGIGEGELKSVTAVRHFSLSQLDADADFSAADVFRLDETFDSQFLSQELTYTTPVAPLNANLVLGAFISDEQLKMTRRVYWGSQAQVYINTLLFSGLGLPPGTAAAPPGLWASERMAGSASSYAGFAHFDAKLSSTVNLILGARYSIERKTGRFGYDFFTPLRNAAFRVLQVAPGPSYDRATNNRALSGTVGLQYRPNADTMVYLTYNRGFKAGGVNIDANAAGTNINNPAEVPGALPLDPIYRPETVNAGEFGAKLQYLGGRARTNVAVFYNSITNLQVAQFVGLRFTVLNARSAELYGAEIENLFEIVPGVQLNLDATWLPHAQYGSDASLGSALSGQRFRYAPKLAGNASLNLDLPMTSDLRLTGRAQYQYSSAQFINTASVANRGAVSVVNANLGLKSERLGVTIEGFVQNLFNKTYPTVAFNTPLQAGDENVYLAPSRTYGVTLRGSF